MTTPAPSLITPEPTMAPLRPTTATATPVQSQPQDQPALERLGVLPWLDLASSEDGQDPRSAYVETFWLGILGPSTTLLLRRLAEDFDAAPDGFEIDCIAVSREIGLGIKMTKRSPFVRTIERCVKFNLAQLEGDLLYVRRQIPRLSSRQVARLSPRLQALHGSWTLEAADDGAQRRTELMRAAHLARTLLALGESTHDAERQLHSWHFHPSIAWHAVQWAQADPEEQPF